METASLPADYLNLLGHFRIEENLCLASLSHSIQRLMRIGTFLPTSNLRIPRIA